MHLNLRDHQLKIITHVHRLLYINLMVTISQKSITDTHTQKRKEFILTLKIVIKSQGRRKQKEERTK